MRCDKIVEQLEKLSPLFYAEEWDNVGLQIGREDKRVETICIALDATDEVIDEAIAKGADLLITHHPLIFKGLKKVSSEDFVGRRVYRIIQNDMNFYAMHTNFDVMGMADATADELSLKARQVLSITYEDEIAKEGIGRFGKLPYIQTLEECAAYVKKVFALDFVKVYGEKELTIEYAAVLPGSGADYIEDAIKAGAQVIITGDVKYHEALDAMAKGIAVIDAGHFGLEKIFITYLKDFLKREFPDVNVMEIEQTPPCWIQ